MAFQSIHEEEDFPLVRHSLCLPSTLGGKVWKLTPEMGPHVRGTGLVRLINLKQVVFHDQKVPSTFIHIVFVEILQPLANSTVLCFKQKLVRVIPNLVGNIALWKFVVTFSEKTPSEATSCRRVLQSS